MIDVSLDVSFAASLLLWPTSERKGVNIILFTASAVHLSSVTLLYHLCVGEFPRSKSTVVCT